MRKIALCRLIIICMLVGLVPCVQAQPIADTVSVELGNQNIENGISLIENPASYLVGTETRASYGTRDGVGCKVIGGTPNSSDSYAYFKLSDEARRAISGNIYLMLDFYDYAPVKFWIEYNGKDGAYTKSEIYTSQGSSNWVQTVLALNGADFKGGQHYGSDFRLVIKYGANYSLPIKSVSLCKTLNGNEKYTPYINIAMKNISGGIEADFSNIIFKGENTMAVKDAPIEADINSEWGAGNKNLMAVVKYYDNESSLAVEYLKNGKWTETESIGGFGTNRFERKVVSLPDLTVENNLPEIRLVRKSGKEPVYVSGFLVRMYDEKVKTENGNAVADASGEELMSLETDAEKEIAVKNGLNYISYSAESGNFALSVKLNKDYVGEAANDLFVELQYGDSSDAEIYAEYVNDKGDKVTGGKVSVKGDKEDKIQTFILKNAVCGGSDEDIKFYVSGKLAMRSLRIYKTTPVSKDYYFDSWNDLNNNGKIVTSQNTHNWQFMKYAPGEGYEYLQLDNQIPSWKDGKNLPGIYVHGNERFVMQPGGKYDFVLAWTAPKSGTATVFSRPHMSNAQPGSDGIKADVVCGGRTYSSKVVDGNDTVGTEDIIELDVKKGENIYFRINSNVSTSYDFGDWRPIIILEEKESVTAASREAYINPGIASSGEGLKLKNEYSSVKFNSGNVVLTNDYSKTPSVAVKADDDFRYRDSGINPVYVEVTLQNKNGAQVWCEYHGIDGTIKRSASVVTTETNTDRNVSFILKEADFGSELPWHFKVCANQQEGTVISKIKTTQVMPKSYILTLSAEDDEYNGLRVVSASSRGVSTVKTDGRSAICLSGTDAKAYVDADNTYVYLNGKNKAYLMIEYFDNLTEFGVEYTNSSGKNEKTETVGGGNSLTWKNAVFSLAAPIFNNGQAGGSDFKIFASDRDKLNIAKISLSTESFPKYYIGVDNGSDTDASGIKIITGENTVEIAGKTAVEVGTSGVGYDIDDKAYGKLSGDNTIYNITVEYLDVPDTEFMLTYDAKKIKIFDEHNAETWRIKTGGSGKWKTANFPVSGAYFANGQPNEADFTILKTSGDEKFYVSEVTVRKGYGELYDIATEKCIPIVSSAIYNSDRIENPNFDLNYRLLAPNYRKYGNDKYIEGTCRITDDFVELHIPSLTPRKISGVLLSGAYDDFKVEIFADGKWETVCNGRYAGNMSADYRIVTFEPVEASAVRVSGTAYYGYSAYNKFQVFSSEPDNSVYHSGSLELSASDKAYDNEDVNIGISYRSNDENEGNYIVKADILNNAGEVVRKDAFSEEVPSNGEKNMTFTLAKTDELYSPGAYTLEVEVLKGDILLDRKTKLFGIKGITKHRDLTSLQLPISKRTLTMGTVGQFNYVTGKVIPKWVFEDLRDSGYDTIQIEVYMREIEPIKGVFDFTTLDRDIEYAMEAGLNVSLWLEFQDAMTPEWIPDEERMCDQFGIKASARRQDIGGFFGDTVWPSAWSETFLTETENCIRNMCERYDNLTNVVSYGVGAVNCEIFFPDDYENYDYSESAQKAYREKYLKENLGLSLDDVSKRYGRNYSSWDEVRLQVPERDAKGDFSAAAWDDFLSFKKYSTTQFFKRNLRILNSAAPGKPTSMFGSVTGSYDKEIYDLIRLNASSMACAASNELATVVPDLSFAGNTLGGWIHGEPGYLPATSGHEGNVGRAYFHSAESGKLTMNWQATPMYSGAERAEIMGQSNVYKAEQQVMDLLRIGEEVNNCEAADNEIAAIGGTELTAEFGEQSNSRWAPNAYTIDINKDGVDGVLPSFVQNSGTVSGIDYYNDYEYNIFCTPEILKKYKLVIDRNNRALRPEIVENMTKYVKNGGTLLLFSDSGMIDPSLESSWSLLKSLSGGRAVPSEEKTMEIREFKADGSPIFKADSILYIKNFRDISGWTWAQTVAETGGVPLVKMWDYGAGKVIYCAGVIYPGDYGSLGNNFLRDVCDYAGVSIQAENSNPTYDGGSTYSVYKRVKSFGKDRYLMLFANNWGGNTFTKPKLNAVEPNTLYRVYYAHRDYDEFLQTTSGGEFLEKEISLPSAATSVLKYTTDRLFSAVGDFNRQESVCWSYYSGGKQIEKFNEKEAAYKDGEVVFKEKTTLPAAECSRVWTAPADGMVSIKGYAALTNDGGNVSGKILLNGQELESFVLTGKNRHRIYLAEKVNAGDKISFVLENKGDLSLAETDWNPQLALNEKAEETKLESGLSGSGTDKFWTAPSKGRIVIKGKASGNALARIVKDGEGLLGGTVKSDKLFYIDAEVEKGQKIEFRTENGKPLEWNGSIWLLQ